MERRLSVFASLSRRQFTGSLLVLTLIPLLLPAALAQDSASRPSLSLSEKESFLRNAKVVKSRAAKKGITDTVRATLSDGKFTNDASIQRIDFYRRVFETPAGVQLAFRDSYKYNIAAYRLAVLLDIDNVPPSVERSFDGSKGAYTWWIEDVMMDEGDRLKRKIEPPDALDWNEQMYVVRVFDQLIDNIDRNAGNLLITKDWRVWMIDHTRAFRPTDKLRDESSLRKCDRTLLARLRALSFEQLRTNLGDYLTPGEIRCLLNRRDLLVRHYDEQGAAGLYDLKRHVSPLPAEVAAH